MLPLPVSRTCACASKLRPRALFLKSLLVSVILPSFLPTRKMRRVQTFVLLLILLAAGAGSAAAQTFSAPVNYISSMGPVSITSGDFNGDGYPDLAVANYDANDVTVFINQGNNTFAPGFNYVLVANGLLVGESPIAITSGDFNGDGKPDLVVANQHSRNICVLFNRGSGTFNDPVCYTVGQYPNSVAVGDFNNDGKLDLVVANSVDDTIGVLLNKGDGTFANAVNYTVGRLPVSVSVGDFNNDGQPDIAVANGLANNVSVLINNGNGTFAPAVNYSAGQNPFAIAAGDLNGDGKPDLVVANNKDNTVSVLLNKGNGTFADPANYPAGFGPTSVAVGDFHHDGKPDLVVTDGGGTSKGSVSLLPSNGDGTFAGPTSYPVGLGSSSVVVADFNRDGQLDMAVTNGGDNNISVLFNTSVTGALQFSQANYSVNEGDGFATITVTRTGDTSGTETVDYATSDGTLPSKG